MLKKFYAQLYNGCHSSSKLIEYGKLTPLINSYQSLYTSKNVLKETLFKN